MKTIEVSREAINPEHWYWQDHMIRTGHTALALHLETPTIARTQLSKKAMEIKRNARDDLEVRLKEHGIRIGWSNFRRRGSRVYSKVWTDEDGTPVRLVLHDRPGDCPLEFPGWWGDGDHKNPDISKPWEQFKLILWGKHAEETITEPDRVHQVVRLAGYELILRKVGDRGDD